MVIHTKRSALGRARLRLRGRPPLRRRDGESGSLILDILIGMAIFALIAIIAVSAVGQYRMRAYVQAAVSDATSVANAVSAAISDDAVKNTIDVGYPTGSLSPAALAALEVTPTGTGSQASTVVVTPNAADHLAFNVCVEHRGAFAEYDSNEGIVDSGVMDREGFEGCDYVPPVDTGNTGTTPTNVVVTVDGNDLVVTWDPVDDATDYNVHLDGATTPTWTGSDTTATLPGVGPGDHTVTVTATVDGETSPPSTPAPAPVEETPVSTVDWTGYPNNAGGYEQGVAADAGMQCPGLVGVESRWADTGEQYIFVATLAESDAQFIERTGKGWSKQYIRLINADTGEIGGWNSQTPWTVNDKQKSDLRTSGVREGTTFYVEVSSRNWTGGGASPKCQAVGKVTLRKTPNWTAGTVQTLDGSAVPGGFVERKSAVPCPQISDATYRHNFSYDHIQFRMDNGTEAQYQLFGRSHGPSAVGYNSTFNVGGISPARPGPEYKTWSTQHMTWAGGETMRLDLLLKDTSRNSDNNAWSDYCTVALRATKPMGVQNGDVINNVPVEIISVEPYWGAFGTGI